MSPAGTGARRRGAWALAGLLLLAALWAVRARLAAGPDPEARLAEARTIIEEKFGVWRRKVERAADRLAALGRERAAPPVSLFDRARELIEEEGVDGVVLLDPSDHARVWAGRSFDASRAVDFPEVAMGFSSFGVLDRPAHRVLYAAYPVDQEAALAFLAIEERLPQPRDLAQEIAASAGIARVRFLFGERPVPAASASDAREVRFVVPDICHVTLLPESDSARALRGAAAARLFDRVLLALLLSAGAASGWRLLGRRLAHGGLPRTGLALALVLGVRGGLALLQIPAGGLFGSPGALFLSGFAAAFAGALLARDAHFAGSRKGALPAAAAATACCAILPTAYAAFLDAAAGGGEIFDPLQVLPAPLAALSLAAVCLATVAAFLLARAAIRWGSLVHPWGAAAPLLAVALAALPWRGPLLAAGCGLASLALARGDTRPQRAAALAFLAALVSFLLLSGAVTRTRTAEVAQRARTLVGEDRDREARELLRRAVDRACDPEGGVHRSVAFRIVDVRERGREKERLLAYQLWAASGWESEEACAVQVWDLEGRRLSAFDLDSPPEEWLPPPPTGTEERYQVLRGRGEGAAIRYYVHEFPLQPSGDDRVVAMARFTVPDRWDALLANLRPAIFSEPLARLVRPGSQPLLLADLDAQGAPVRTSDRTTELAPPPAALIARARALGMADAPIRYRDSEARLVVVASSDGYAAIALEESAFQQGAFEFAKILLVDSVVCLLYALVLLLRGGSRLRFLFRHRVALAVVLLSVPPVILLAAYNRRVATDRYEAEIFERLQRRLDLAEALLRKRTEPPDSAWCTAFAADHRADLNLYRSAELIATSRPGVWDTGLLARRLSADTFVALSLHGRADFSGIEPFGRTGALRVAYRQLPAEGLGPPMTLAAPALEDRRTLERRSSVGTALLLAAYLLTATVTVFAALFLARSLTAPLSRLQAATQRVAAGDLAAELPEGRLDEIGDLVRDFNRMTRDLREAQELRARAEREAAWREMARQIAHEIKNPLTPLKLTIQNLLASYREDPEQFRAEFEEGAGRILEQIEALRRIAGEFSAYARFPAPRREALDLAALAREVAALYASGDGTTACEIAAGALPVQADRDEIRRVLINLVTNARQAGARNVVLRARVDGAQALLEVQDDGSGIRPEHRGRLFEPYFTTKTSGAGLGLAIVKQVVEGHGGTIAIDSEPGRGTKVSIRLPR
ncbi:MAG: ATP-binding protein [Planctomycetaceae bacterium]